ncbi:hypothetical protein [Erythrobacter sp.]|uniref:hypothetical protein n=1 Tax=Erythrobacter sp. TaxID=1042 RepID=UPI003C734171
MRLYAAKFVRTNETLHGHIVAPNSEIASEFAEEFHHRIGVELEQFDLMRVDETLPAEYRDSLDDMLESAPIGFATRSTQFGWFVHGVLQPRFKLYTIEPQRGDEVYVIAPNPDMATALWLWSLELSDDGTHPLYRIVSGSANLEDQQLKALEPLLDHSPAGVIKWDEERGWLPV